MMTSTDLLSPLKRYRILVSFYNLPKATEYPLLALNFSLENAENAIWQPVSLGPGITTHHATGLTAHQDIILVAFVIGGESWVAALDANTLVFRWRQRLEGVKDIHSLAMHQGSLLAVSTGTDQVLAYPLNHRQFGEPFVYWQASDTGKDVNHINSLTVANGKVLVSFFGPKRSELWSSTSRNGGILNVDDNVLIKDELDHPHTVSWKDGQVYFCESMKGIFRSIDAALCREDGYARGITWLSNSLALFARGGVRQVSAGWV